ncbi:superoxide dismutase family protein [Roseovarius sp. EL26]|uniref:superoxide dismutase family protein n=1 Tax=Roseovarius sp. EL26 TaxID=2126672 RepID=UPI000EA269B4|nr:superoxide dismutase family protein [Roseovarius sp. EL26]
MIKTTLTSILLTALFASTSSAGHVNAEAHAELINKGGTIIGEAHLKQGPHGVLIHVKVSQLAPGKHGLHLHSHGTCEPGTGFKSAKGHVGKIEGAHGLMNPKGPEAGDLPNLYVGADGIGEMEAVSVWVSIGEGENGLLDADGSSFIIHDAADDHISQPIGGAGARVACGILKVK